MDITKSLYNKLGLRNVSAKEFGNIKETLTEFYKINTFSYFNPNISLFTSYPGDNKALNNSTKLTKLIKKGDRKSTSGFFYKAMLKTRNNSILYKNVFVKEIPIFNPHNINYYYNNTNSLVTTVNSNNHIISSILYDLNEEANIEIFVNYLVSKLKELDISPHFCEYYGSYSANMTSFTYDITDDDHTIDNLDKITKDGSIPFRIIDKNGLYIEYKDVPCYLLITEKLCHDVSYITENDMLTYDRVLSFTFQIFSAIMTMNSLYGIKHNDLHFGNIMIKKTDEEYLYYSLNNTFYRIPTFGFIICILDWGRSTYDFNGYSGKNKIYTSPRDCFRQYIYKRINNKGYSPVELDENRWTDIVMASHSILREFNEVVINTPLEDLLLKNIRMEDEEYLDINIFDWDLYVDITENKFNIKPRELITNKIFHNFIIKKKSIKNKQIYKIYS